MITLVSSPFKINSNKSINWDLSKKPKIFWAESKSNSWSLSKLNSALSNKDKASLTEPSDIFTNNKDDYEEETDAFSWKKNELEHIYYNDGNVGIGTNNPQNLFELNSQQFPQLSIKYNNQSNLVAGILNNRAILGCYNNYPNTKWDSLYLNSDGLGNGGEVYITNGAVISDDRLKHNEKLIDNSLDTIMKLKPQTYNEYRSKKQHKTY